MTQTEIEDSLINIDGMLNSLISDVDTLKNDVSILKTAVININNYLVSMQTQFASRDEIDTAIQRLDQIDEKLLTLFP